MAIWYVDYEGEAGTGDGSSFANRARSVKRIYNTAATADNGTNNSGSTSNADNQIGQADEIRIKKSPDPTSCGAGQIWKEIASGDDNRTVTGTATFTYSTTKGATNVQINNHSLQTGEWVKIFYNSNSNAFVNGYWKITRVDKDNFTLNEYKANSNTVSSGTGGNIFLASGNLIELDNKIIEEVAFGSRTAEATAQSSMTAETNVTAAPPTTENNWGSYYNTRGMITNPEGGQRITISSSFTGTGKAAYMQLPSTLDLSSYQQISLQMYYSYGDNPRDHYATNPTYITQGFSLRLCSDNAGNTSVHTIPLNYYKVNNGYRLTQIVKDFGSNLSNNINSIAIYVDTARSVSRQFDIANIIACKASSSADSVTHDSLMGLHTAAAPQWYPIHWICNSNNKTVIYMSSSATEANRNYPSPSSNNDCATPRWWPQSYNASVTGNTSTTIYKREKFWYQMYNVSSNQTGSSSGGYFMYMGGNNHPLRISGGWNATDMSTKTAGDITCIDGGTGECGHFRFESANNTHSNGSGAGLHADGEDKICHMEDLYFTKMYGYFQYYRHSMSLYNVGICNCSDGFYLYFTHKIKKFGLTCMSGFDDQHSSYHGINFGRHSEGAGIDKATFLLNSDGTKHSTYNKDTRFIKWAAGARGTMVKIGSYKGTDQIDAVEFSIINCEGQRQNAAVSLNTGSQSKLEINELRLGYCDYKGNTTVPMYVDNDKGTPIYIDNLYTSGCYSGFWVNNECNLDIGNWVDDCFDIVSGSNYFRGEGYWSYGYACQVYQPDATVTVHDGITERRPIFYFGAKFFATSLYVETSGGVYNHSGVVEVKDFMNISGNNYKQIDGAYVYADSSVRNTNSGYSMKLRPTHNGGGDMKIGTIVFNGGSQVTVSVYLRKTTQYLYGDFKLTNFSLNSGVSPITNTLSYQQNTTNQWTQYTTTFTPVNAGSCDVHFHVKSQSANSTDYLYLDDLTVSQA